MSCFDDIPRSLQGGYRHPMGSFDYLNLSARSVAARVRTVLDNFLEHYPLAKQADLRLRLRSVDDEKHHSAFFELALHELLITQGFNIISVEPSVPGTDKVPDFLAETDDGEKFYVEARMARGMSKLAVGANKILEDALAAVDSVQSPDYLLGVFWTGSPTKQVPPGKLRRVVQSWIHGLNYDEVKAQWNAETPSQFKYTKYGLTLRIEAAPRQESRGDAGGRSIGQMGPDEVLQVDTHAAIKAAVERKAGRYGDLPHPYIVAVNDMSPVGHYEHSILAALFGTEAAQMYRDKAGVLHHRAVRRPNGAWFTHKPINTRVSAALFVEGLTPWTFSRLQPTLVLNPWSRRPLPDIKLDTDRIWIGKDSKLERASGSTFGQLVGLPADWPSDHEDQREQD